MQGLGKAKGINIKAEEAYGTSPENVLRSAKEKQKLFKDKGTVQIYCLFDKDDCDDEKFKKVIQQCKKAGFVDAIRGQNLKMLAFQKIGVNNVDEFYWYMNV